MRRFLLRLAFVIALPLGALAQDFPTRPITIVFPGGAGIEPDRIARQVADKLRDKWGQPVVVENRPGAGGNVGASHVANAPPDGYTLLFTGAGALVISKLIYSKLTYDPEAFVPVSTVVATPLVLAVNANSPIRSVQQLVAMAKEQPGRINYASAGSGTTTHLTGELFKSMAGINLVHVPYKGLAPAMTDLLGGQVEVGVFDIGTALPQVRAGKLRALGVTTAQRSPLLPDVPAVAEAVPGFSSAFAFVMVAPARTPPAVVEKLSAAIGEAIKAPDVSRQLAEKGTQAVGSTASEMAAFLAQEKERYTGLVKALNLKAD
ncbi:MAG TPA: tripartite tricarboxylate transporter substrate binding protein [Ramlibacter sp.]|nr:tripartite tricarboxylate transporter substrate binding protein [Ramlibacter sp.]